MFKIWRSSEAWHLLDTHQSIHPFVYEDMMLLLEDLGFLMEGYEIDAKFI